MCSRNSVFGRCVGRVFYHPRLRKPSDGGRKGPFALACFQRQVASGQQFSDAAGVCSSHSSSAARLARRIALSLRPLPQPLSRVEQQTKPLAWDCYSCSPGVRTGKNGSFWRRIDRKSRTWESRNGPGPGAKDQDEEGDLSALFFFYFSVVFTTTRSPQRKLWSTVFGSSALNAAMRKSGVSGF